MHKTADLFKGLHKVFASDQMQKQLHSAAQMINSNLGSKSLTSNLRWYVSPTSWDGKQYTGNPWYPPLQKKKKTTLRFGRMSKKTIRFLAACLFSNTPLKINGWNIIMEVWKIIFLSKWVICRFHVNLPGCNHCLIFSFYKLSLNPKNRVSC